MREAILLFLFSLFFGLAFGIPVMLLW